MFCSYITFLARVTWFQMADDFGFLLFCYAELLFRNIQHRQQLVLVFDEHCALAFQLCKQRLRGSMRRGDLVARISGDEFAIAIEGLSTVDELETIIEKLRRRLAEPYRIRGHKVIATASIGIALYPDDAPDTRTLIHRADLAMYRAKAQGGGYVSYSPSLDSTLSER